MTNLDNAFEKINRFVNFEEGDRKTYMDDLNDVTKFVIENLKKQDEVFNSLYNGHYFQGSYMDNLKINKPNEYDIILQLKLPKSELARILPDSNKPGNVIIKIADILDNMPKNTPTHYEIYNRLDKSTNNCKCLDQRKISSWFQSMFSNVLNTNPTKITINDKNYDIFRKVSGPAQTIEISDNMKGIKISVDYVPGFIFTNSQWVAKERNINGNDNIMDWLAIPKPDKTCYRKGISNISFRSSFSNTERELIWDKNQLKNVCKLLKKFRDNQNIQNIKSYHIKTLFLWENKRQDENFWNKPTSYLFVHMFEQLVECVETGNLKFFWDANQNMLGDLKPEQIRTMAGQIRAIYEEIKNLQSTKPISDRLYGIFLNKEEIKILKIGGTMQDIQLYRNHKKVKQLLNRLKRLKNRYTNPNRNWGRNYSPPNLTRKITRKPWHEEEEEEDSSFSFWEIIGIGAIAACAFYFFVSRARTNQAFYYIGDHL